jgi:hypothetical protein
LADTAVLMLVCAERGDEIEDGQAHVERADDPRDEDATPELAWFCQECAEREFGYRLCGTS